MNHIEKELLEYENILSKIKHSLNIFTFESIKEKTILISLLEEKIDDLKYKNEELNYWINRTSKIN